MKKIEYLRVDQLHPHPANPRKELGDLTELAESIKSNGVLQNLTVVPYWSPVHKRTMNGLYTVIIGHRRLAAAKLAGLTELPCVVADLTPQKQFQTMMIENVNRSDLTTYEQAEGFQMMLDMGDTVESVAKQTGFSETTIRRRMKLLELNKEKFNKAEERGGTMQDYLKLQSISDPATRDKVLDTVGTPNFNVTLMNAVAKEEEERIADELYATIKDADWCREIDPDAVRDHGRYTYVRAISKHNPNATPPEDAGTAAYIYYRKDNYIYLYKENPKDKAADLLAEKKKRLDAELDELDQELEEVSARHQDSRDEFFLNFTGFNSSEMDIATFAVKAMIYAVENRITIDTDRLGNLLGVPVSAEGELDPKAWNKVLFNRPQYALLCTAYTMLEGSGQTYHTRKYNPNTKIKLPVPKEKNLALDLIYAGLKSLEYEMSDEEKQMQNGTHPLYKRAKFLADDYLREKEAADG